jgi:gliding motility-associated-like protein
MHTLLTWLSLAPTVLVCLELVNGPPAVVMEEICDNAIDDDADGLIDLNDPDCDCPVAEPVSLIPNPSFEEKECCPSNRSELYCADTWIQASEATTDYLHTCGWMGWPDLPPPLPFPDGDAAIGFRNGRFGRGGDGESVPNWKEYTGACLLAPLRKNVAYRFEFSVGFTHPNNSPPTDVVFFGATDCDNLPFGIGDQNFGCPTNGPGWRRLGSVYVAGGNNWIKTSIQIRPSQDIYAIAIGPSCQEMSWDTDLYYFFDNLVLAEQSAFEFDIIAEGHPCSDQYTLSLPNYDTLSYQWYKDGVALVGETAAELQVKTGSGNYVARVLSSEGCKVTKPFRHTVPVIYATIKENICPGDSYDFHGRAISEPGIYWDTLKNAFNCDSVIQLDVFRGSDQIDTVRAKIFPGEYYPVGPKKFFAEGAYDVTIQSSIGCDSLVWLGLEHFQVYIPNAFSPNFDGQNDRFSIQGGTELLRIQKLQVFDRWGNLLYSGADMPPNDRSQGWDGRRQGKEAPNGVYLYLAILEMEDGVARQVSGSFTLLR